jgi:hypothetical protein
VGRQQAVPPRLEESPIILSRRLHGEDMLVALVDKPVPPLLYEPRDKAYVPGSYFERHRGSILVQLEFDGLQVAASCTMSVPIVHGVIWSRMAVNHGLLAWSLTSSAISNSRTILLTVISIVIIRR